MADASGGARKVPSGPKGYAATRVGCFLREFGKHLLRYPFEQRRDIAESLWEGWTTGDCTIFQGVRASERVAEGVHQDGAE